MMCPRRDENFAYPGLPKEDRWIDRDGRKVCSYCGSLHPDSFMECLRDGCLVEPTDKNYKAYIELPNPKVGKRVCIGSSYPSKNWLKRKLGWSDKTHGIAGPTITAKFYYRHLSTAQMQEFVKLLNAKELSVAYPGHFYVYPFFIQSRPKDEA